MSLLWWEARISTRTGHLWSCAAALHPQPPLQPTLLLPLELLVVLSHHLVPHAMLLGIATQSQL